MARLSIFSLATILITICNSIAVINPPYITSASPVSGFSIYLQWRNNSFDTKGFIVLRETGNSGNFAVVDTVPLPYLSHTDEPLQTSTNYCYRLIAYNDTATSDSSNMLCATTLSTDSLKAFPILLLHLDTLHAQIKISVINLSPGADGYRLYRKDNPSASSVLLHTFTNISPLDSMLFFVDSTVSKDRRYFYDIEVYNSTNTVKGAGGSLFVYDPYVPTAQDSIIFSPLGRIPLSGFTGWARLIHDSLFIKDKLAGQARVSIISTKDLSNPVYLGPVQDSILNSYDALYGIIDTAFPLITYRYFPFIYGYGSSSVLTMSVHNKDNYDRIDSVAGAVAITSKYVLHTATRSISRFSSYSYTAISQKYSHFTNDSLSNVLPTWVIGDSNFVLASQCPKWEVYSVSDGGKDLVDRYACIWPYSRMYCDFTCQDANNRAFFFYPYLFQITNERDNPNFTRILEVIDVRQADTCKILGQLTLDIPVRVEANLVLFDTARNLLFVFYPSELDLYSINKKIQAHMGGQPPALQVQHKDSQSDDKIGLIRFVGKGTIQIIMPKRALPCNVSLYTLSGRTIARLKDVQAASLCLPIANLTRGIYILSIKSPEIIYSEKLIIN